MAKAVTIRAAVVGDAEAVAALLAELGYPQQAASTAQSLQLALADPRQAVWVAEVSEPQRTDGQKADGQHVDGKGPTAVVGFAAATTLFYFHLGRSIARLSSLVVSERMRGQQLGAQLLAAAERWAGKQGCDQLELTSSTRRERAHGFYRRAGYEPSAYRFVRRLARLETDPG